jgi:peroxiredoxin
MFYPFAFTGKCAQELCTIRDERKDFVNEDTQILSISCDPVASLKIFAEEQNLTTPLLSDFWPHGKVSKDYGVFLEDLGFANRGTFVIDKAGIIRWKVVTSPGEVRNTSDYRKALSAL